MFLVEASEYNLYLSMLLDKSSDKENILRAVGNLLRLHKFNELFENYHIYKDVINDDKYLERLTRYCLGLKYFLDVDFEVLDFIKVYFKINTRFPKNKFSSDYKYLLRLRDKKRYLNVNYILDNQL